MGVKSSKYNSGDPPPIKQIKGECTICQNGPVNLVLLSSRCHHQPSICVQCHTSFISREIQSTGSHRLVCLVARCSTEYEFLEYKHLLNVRQREIIEKILLNRTLEATDDFRWCKSDKGCGAGQLVSNHTELSGYYTCYKCHTPMCFRHSIKWHQGFTCDEFDVELSKNADLASDVTVLECSKKCPNDHCRTTIMKLEGCDVMTCCRYGTHICGDTGEKCDHGGRNYCGQRFCWKCLGKMEFNKKENRWIRKCKENCEYASLNE